MSTIAASLIFLRADFTSYESGKLHQLLRSRYDDLKDTRKGRHWEAWKESVGITVHVYRTDEYLYDCEDELLELDLLPEDAPECVSVVTNLGREQDLAACAALTEAIADELKGVTLGATLSS